jgi:hypothetical protein
MFFSDDLVEIALATSKDSKSIRGRFDGKRLAEFSWSNESNATQRLAIRARAVGGDRELRSAEVCYRASGHTLIGFGMRSAPADTTERRGAYPFEALMLGFVLFGEP